MQEIASSEVVWPDLCGLLNSEEHGSMRVLGLSGVLLVEKRPAIACIRLVIYQIKLEQT